MGKFIYKGETIEIGPQRLKYLSQNLKVSSKDLQDRLNSGWDLEDALKYNYNHVMYKGKVCRRIRHEGIRFYIVAEDLQRSKVPPQTIMKYLKEGQLMDDILPLETEFYIEEHKKDALRNLVYKDRLRKERKKEQAEARKRAERPWLYDGTPQSVKPSPWYLHLCENDLMVKKVH
ncbi:SA1788 family PVL leukocidin-associated protein [Staphylococcus simulans]|uniref:SA1788 family PVL leukocidin-associated protein n=1 Tax=Staphylococcus simulans TaxID=1286 RepID=UPI000AB24334|nr:SA1788 family PVL leukocidin-associated protein [Staphylococcus simulans]